MATNIKGPGIYLAQFASDQAPFDSWDSITKWAAGLAGDIASRRIPSVAEGAA